MSRFISFLLVLTLVLTLSSVSYAQTPQNAGTEVTIDLKDLDSITRNNVIELLKDKKEAENTLIPDIKKVDPATIKTWAESISGVIKTICGELNVSVNDFIKTDAGKITVFFVGYKMVGQDIKKIVFSILWAFVALPIVLISFRYFHTSVRVTLKDKDGNEKVGYVPRYDWGKNRYGEQPAKITSAIFHGIFIAAILIIVLIACLS